jgi:hypothetical protein
MRLHYSEIHWGCAETNCTSGFCHRVFLQTTVPSLPPVCHNIISTLGTAPALIVFVADAIEPTRLISKSSQAPVEQPKNSFSAVNAPDADVFQLLPGDVVRGLNRSSEAQRVMSELRYLEFYASQIGKAIGFTTPEVVIVEDAEHQTGFRRVTGSGSEPVHYGLTRVGKKRLAQVRKELGKED